ncbi:MAG TPA: 6-phosphogluconolactonase [Candidatus Saccharimonadales bacterium]|nr:6-phosphogluconolactonase [Candidatus Saccharimonadales bacterium]
MKFVKQTNLLAEVLAEALEAALKKHDRVIWLVSGGSNVPISVETMRLLDAALTAKLVILQADERFVAADSPDCNWYQLFKAGFESQQAKTYPILSGEFDDVNAAAAAYEKVVQKQFAEADYIIAQLGIGGDGHTAGILPGGPAASAKELVTGYAGERFERVTLTFPALQLVDEAYAFAYGPAKLYALTRLKDNQLPLEVLPAGVLKGIARAVVYNDQIEGEAK